MARHVPMSLAAALLLIFIGCHSGSASARSTGMRTLLATATPAATRPPTPSTAKTPSPIAHPPSSPPPKAASAWDQVFDLVKSAASGLGLSDAVSFFKEVVPAVSGILDDAPVVVLYLRRLFKNGVPSKFDVQHGKDSKVTNALYNIIKTTISTTLTTDTGSLVADLMLQQQGVNLAAVAGAQNFREVADVLDQGVWDDVRYTDYGVEEAVVSVLKIMEAVATEILAPNQRLSAQQFGTDLVSTALALVSDVLEYADLLRDEANGAITMHKDEYEAFHGLEMNLLKIESALDKLDFKMRHWPPPSHPSYSGNDRH